MTKFSLICSVSNGTECYSKKGLMNSWSILYTVPATSDKNPQYGKKLHTFRQVCQINKNPWILRILGFLFIWQTCLQVFSYFFHISDFVFCHRTVSIKMIKSVWKLENDEWRGRRGTEGGGPTNTNMPNIGFHSFCISQTFVLLQNFIQFQLWKLIQSLNWTDIWKIYLRWRGRTS